MNENETWYVKAAVRRGLESIKADNKVAEKYLETPDLAGTFRDMAEGLIAHNNQLLHEMKQYIPTELQPQEN